VKNFEERLEKLEKLGEKVRSSEIPLDEALAAFEEGVKIAQTLEKDLEKVENRIEALMSDPGAGPDEKPELTLFDSGN
jgi:exodeoxyribonuclease VII small subunit